ncbi:pickpocket protein 28-like [Ostrinia nubilalis]|uniref:pickpocket protein 28-like n=1 Tax=Ostrinia nubilalis TaxID=29057 RepID=UPI00308269C0
MNEEAERPVVGEVCLRRKRRKRQKKLLKQLFQDYSKNTTLHGLRYTTEKGLHIIEKIFWLVTFIVSVALSFYLISKVWNKWNTSPVIVSFSEKHLFVKEVPFPAITICPAVKFKNFNYTEILADLENHEVIDNDTLATASAVNLFCDWPAEELINELPGDWMDRLLNVSMEVDDIFYVCKLGKNDCTDLVKRVLTEDGICFNINGLAASDILNYNTIQREFKYSYNEHEARNWTFTEGYTNDDVNAYPYRGQESGETPYLSLNLADLEPIKDKNCNVVYTGYKIYLHHPADWPQAQSYYFAALPEQVSSMAVEFSAVSTSKDLQAVALNVVFKTIRHDLKTEKLEDPPNIFHVEKLHNDITDLPLHLK